jgi:hypothetical protein
MRTKQILRIDGGRWIGLYHIKDAWQVDGGVCFLVQDETPSTTAGFLWLDPPEAPADEDSRMTRVNENWFTWVLY